MALGTWTPLAHAAPDGVSLMLLLSDGTVMCAGSGTSWNRLTPDINGSYVNGTWTALAPMHDSRRYYSSQVLPDGRVFVAGGEYGTGKNRAEMYDPVANIWTQLAAPPNTVIDNASETLPNGDILEGSPGTDTRIYDVAADTWSATITPPGGLSETSLMKLQDGSLLCVVDGYSERFIPSLNKWVRDANLATPLYGWGYEIGAGVLLPNGKVFYIGGTNHTGIYTPWTTNYAGIYTPAGATNMGTWTAGPDIPNHHAAVDAPAAMMVNGKILCCMTDTDTGFGSHAVYYEYDYLANAFTPMTVPSTVSNTVAYGTTMLDLPDGTVLVSGFGSTVYNYKPDGVPLAAGAPTILSVTTNLDGSLHLTGLQFNGISEGAYYGDDSQVNTDYPIARMTNASGNVLYCRTYNWSTCNLMTGTNVVTTEMTLPAGMLAGTYPLVVTANGIASAPYFLTISGTPLPAVAGLRFSTIASNRMILNWNDLGLTETGYVVQRSTDGTNYSSLALLGGNTTTYTDNAVTPLGEYYYRVQGTNSFGSGLAAPAIFAASKPVVAVPAPWQYQDVGGVLGRGASGQSAGTYTVIGSGSGIGADSDQFQFVYQPVVGDVTITARVVASENTGASAMAGVMIRNNLASDVADAVMVFAAGAQASIFEHRAAAADMALYGLVSYGDPDEELEEEPSGGGGGSSTIISQPASAPLWVRLVRSGNTVTGYTSTNGSTWTPQGTATLALSPEVEVGLAVCSGTYNQLNTSTFDNVTVAGTAAAIPPALSQWKLDETSGTIVADSIDGFDGLCNSMTLGLAGATPNTAYAAGFNGTSSFIDLPPLNLSSNVLTITGWINRNGNQGAWSGIFFNRANSTVAGLHFGTANELRYTWNNDFNTYNWNSGLVVPDGQWTFVSLVIEPTRARLYMATSGVLLGATNNVANPLQAFDGNTQIGQDSTGGRFFKGQMDEVRLYNQALTPTQLTQLAAPPFITFTTLTNGQQFAAPANINLTASVTSGHTVNQVQFFNDNNLLAQFSTPPYTNTVTNLPLGSYTFSARLYYDSGYFTDSGPVTALVQPPPDVPQNVVATALASNLIYVSWSPANLATGYVLNRNGVPIANVGGATYYLVDTGLAASASYCYTVTATNPVASSAPSASACATTPATQTALTWDANSLLPNPQDGNGNWDNSTTTWWNDSIINTVWINNSLAQIGNGTTTNCIVTLTNALSAAGLLFNVNNGGNYTLSGSTLTLTTPAMIVADNNATISSGLAGGAGLTKTGPGILTLSGANTYTGGTTISMGTLKMGGGSALSSGSVTIKASGTLDLNAYSVGAVTVNGGVIDNSVGSDGHIGALTLNGSAIISDTGGGWNGINSSTVTGTGNLVLAGKAWAAGPITMNMTGYLVISNSAQFDTYGVVTFGANVAGVNIVSNGIFHANGAETVRSLSGDATAKVWLGSPVTVNQITAGTFAGVISGGNALTKTGVGVLTLTGANTYAGGTTISVGTLQVDGTTGSGTVIVGNTATLAGTGTVKGATTIQSGGTLASGDAGIGTLAFAGALTLNAGSKTVLELSKNGSLANDRVAVTGALALGGTLTVTNISTNTLALGDSFDLLNAGTFSGNFSAKTLPALATNLVWDTSQLATNGIIFVASLPVITNQPQSLVVNAGSPAGFAVGATGSGVLAYQWQLNGANLAGATSSAYSLASTAATNTGNYTVVITNNYGAVTSQVATLTLVNVTPAISGASVSGDGTFGFSFSGPAGQSYHVYAANDLTLPLASWLVVTNGTFGPDAAIYSEAITNGPQRFFRVGSP